MSLNSASLAELGLMVALRVAPRNTCTICRNDHSLSHSPIRLRSSCASGSVWPAVTYQTMMTDCIDHTHGASFATLSWHQCGGASIARTCLLALNRTSMDHLQA